MATKPTTNHRWRFFRSGGVDQVRIERGSDVLNLHTLDQKLWVALSCPVRGLEFDERTLALLDTDGDGRVRAPELVAATQWLGKVLKDADELTQGVDGVKLSSIRDDTDEGRSVLASAKHILASLGKESSGAITIGDTLMTAEVFAQARFNGDGVVPPASLSDADARAVAEEIVRCTGGAIDRSGLPGFDGATLDAFFADCAAYAAWRDAGAADADAILPLGDATGAALAAIDAVRTKVDDFFARCRLAAFDERALAALNKEESAYLEVAAKDLSITVDEVAQFPLASIQAGRELPLEQDLNPAWTAAMTALRDAAVRPLLGEQRASLSEADWTALCAKLAPYRAWQAGKAGASVESLGLERVRAILAGGTKDALAAAIDEDKALASRVDAITSVEKLARLHRDLFKLLNNFVSFTDFYARRTAIFQAGTLYFDGRACDLCVQVLDAAKHGTLAPMSKSYLAYLDCTRPDGQKLQIAAAFTAGDSDNLFVGRNGLFYDRKGRDWDATITKIVDNPISIGQAFWSPYKKLLRWIEEQVAKKAAAADADASTKLQTSAATAGTAASTGTAAPPKKMDIGVLAAISVAIGGIATVLGGIMEAFFGLGYLMPLGLLGLMLLISGPSMVIAWLKLRQRNLGPLLDANGWAVNALTRVNLPLGRSLTAVSAIPEGAERSLKDPYAPKKSAWPRVLLVLLVLAGVGYGLYRFGYLHEWLPEYVPAYVSDELSCVESAKAGETVEIGVPAGTSALSLYDSASGAVTALAVTDGKASFTVPEGTPVGTRFTVSDPARPELSCAFDVVE
ncbi:MAG: hypothetical protein H6825_02845 [Planctomycetes bacterium]|nr:hypothetical protein [Planctomycetota bacterium]